MFVSNTTQVMGPECGHQDDAVTFCSLIGGVTLIVETLKQNKTCLFSSKRTHAFHKCHATSAFG